MRENETTYSLNIPDTSKPRIVIIGGGFGGINLIKHLNTNDFQVVLIDRYNYHTFQPLLYQVATAGLEPDSVAGPLRKITKRKRGIYFRMLKVIRVIPEHHTIQTSVGSLTYDILVVATGAKVNFFHNTSIAEHALPLKQITHALDLRSQIFQQFEKLELLTDRQSKEKYMSFVVVGAGPTGVELCGALAELKNKILPKDYPELNLADMKIYLVEGLDRVLPSMSTRSSTKTRTYLEDMGVRVILNRIIKEYDGEVATLSDDSEIYTGTLIWAAGVTGSLINGFNPRSIEKGKLRVNDVNQVYRNAKKNMLYKNIFAIGDVALMKPDNYPDGLPGLAQVAIQQGKHLAKNLNTMNRGGMEIPFAYKNKGVLATVGKNRAVADFPGNLKLSGTVGWFIWMVVHLLFLIGFRNKTVVFANWMWNYFTYDRGIRLILRPSTKEHDPISRDMIEEMSEADN